MLVRRSDGLETIVRIASLDVIDADSSFCIFGSNDRSMLCIKTRGTESNRDRRAGCDKFNRRPRNSIFFFTLVCQFRLKSCGTEMRIRLTSSFDIPHSLLKPSTVTTILCFNDSPSRSGDLMTMLVKFSRLIPTSHVK